VTSIDAIVVGSGPNGLAAAVVLARAGLTVTVFEANSTIGGGARTAELTLPGFLHDVCSAVHPMALASPFFRAFRLEERVPMVVPELSYAHPFDGGAAALAYRDLERTANELGADGRAWNRLFGPLVREVDALAELTSSTLVRVPRHPVVLGQLGLRVLEQGSSAWNARFREHLAPALLSGAFAHAIRPLPGIAPAAAGIVLATHAHARGWPIPVGGSQAIIDALAADLLAHGGSIVTDTRVARLAELPSAKAVLFDTSARALGDIVGDAFPERYRRRLRAVRYGNAVAKVDFALSAAVPWLHPEVARAGTVHLGGTRAEVARAERDVARGRIDDRPFVLVSQPSTFDPSRAPAGKHTLWAYTHVPRGSTADRTEAVIGQIERFAPGFRDTILGMSSQTAVDVASHNANYVGGDIAAGAPSLSGLIRRPTIREPWRTPARGVYLCSAATSPGPGVHGLSGLNAARSALAHEFGIRALPELG
jgi:phytoene dehydrogenase-like protein